MPGKRVLSVGQCGFDHGQLSQSLQQMFGALEQSLGGSITQAPYNDPKTGELKTPLAGGALAETLKANLSSPLMVAVAVISFVLGYWKANERWTRFKWFAEYHSRLSDMYREARNGDEILINLVIVIFTSNDYYY